MKKLCGLLSLLLVSGVAVFGGTLNVASSATPNGSLYNYSYTFSVTGTGGGFDNIFLGSDDLSPLNVQLSLNGAPTVDWSYLGNDTPQNYLQFFSLSSTPLAVGNNLLVTFSSILHPGNTHFAVALNSGTNTTSNQVTGVTAPTAVPEPGSAAMLLTAGLAAMCLLVKRLAH
jgi:hypothetical protein